MTEIQALFRAKQTEDMLRLAAENKRLKRAAFRLHALLIYIKGVEIG